MGYGIKIFVLRPLHYVTRSPGHGENMVFCQWNKHSYHGPPAFLKPRVYLEVRAHLVFCKFDSCFVGQKIFPTCENVWIRLAFVPVHTPFMGQIVTFPVKKVAPDRLGRSIASVVTSPFYCHHRNETAATIRISETSVGNEKQAIVT